VPQLPAEPQYAGLTHAEPYASPAPPWPSGVPTSSTYSAPTFDEPTYGSYPEPHPAQPYAPPISPAPQTYSYPVSPAPAPAMAPAPVTATIQVIPAPAPIAPAATPIHAEPQAAPHPGQLYGPPPIPLGSEPHQPPYALDDQRPSQAPNRFDLAAILLAVVAILVSPMGIVLPPAFGILAILCGATAHRRGEPQGKLSLLLATGATALGMLAALVITLL
jgi:hypothetical protein